MNKIAFHSRFVVLMLFFLLSGCVSQEGLVSSPEETQWLPSPSVESSDLGSKTQWQKYENPTTGIRFSFPGDWFGPEVYEYDNGIRIEIGSDLVYPYGTSVQDRVSSRSDAYFIVIQLDTQMSNFVDEAFLELFEISLNGLKTAFISEERRTEFHEKFVEEYREIESKIE